MEVVHQRTAVPKFTRHIFRLKFENTSGFLLFLLSPFGDFVLTDDSGDSGDSDDFDYF